MTFALGLSSLRSAKLIKASLFHPLGGASCAPVFIFKSAPVWADSIAIWLLKITGESHGRYW